MIIIDVVPTSRFLSIFLKSVFYNMYNIYNIRNELGTTYLVGILYDIGELLFDIGTTSELEYGAKMIRTLGSVER
jgi:hypothetical protein